MGRTPSRRWPTSTRPSGASSFLLRKLGQSVEEFFLHDDGAGAARKPNLQAPLGELDVGPAQSPNPPPGATGLQQQLHHGGERPTGAQAPQLLQLANLARVFDAGTLGDRAGKPLGEASVEGLVLSPSPLQECASTSLVHNASARSGSVGSEQLRIAAAGQRGGRFGRKARGQLVHRRSFHV